MKTKVRKVTSPPNSVSENDDSYPRESRESSPWEVVDHDAFDIPHGYFHTLTERLAVPGGWLYRCREWCNESDSTVAAVGTVAIAFVPKRGAQ